MLACPRRSCHAGLVAIGEPVRAMTGRPAMLLRRGRILEGITLGWNVAGIAVLAVTAVTARSVALAGFGLDSLIETGASTVVLGHARFGFPQAPVDLLADVTTEPGKLVRMRVTAGFPFWEGSTWE
jgi:hypothetical protein